MQPRSSQALGQRVDRLKSPLGKKFGLRQGRSRAPLGSRPLAWLADAGSEQPELLLRILMRRTPRVVLLAAVCTPPSPRARRCALIVFFYSGVCHCLLMLRPAVALRIKTFRIIEQLAHVLAWRLASRLAVPRIAYTRRFYFRDRVLLPTLGSC